MTTDEILDIAVKQKPVLASAGDKVKNKALLFLADSIEAYKAEIIVANGKDVENARGKVSEVMLDRLTLNEKRLKGMADSVREVAVLPDPVGRVLEENDCKNGLLIRKVSVPLGVLAMIYESRPNVTSDAAALSLKSGNVCVLRGGKEAIESNKAIVKAMREGIAAAGLPADSVNLVTDTSRDSANRLMTAVGKVDLLIPRGGAGLIRSCVENAKVPCIETGTGICHIYIDSSADIDMALRIVENAKTSRPSVCNAAEVCLVNSSVAGEFLPKIKGVLVESRKKKGLVPVELRCDNESAAILGDGIIPAGERDFDTEFLDYKMAVKIVGSVDEAIEHIRKHSTGHSEAIVTADSAAAERFTMLVDSAAVYVNASTRFTDGGEFGLGCEMGISTQKLHARGPMGLRELTSYKYIVRGNGQIR